MDCKKAQRLFDDLAEGRLPDATALRLSRHIQECTDCRVLQQRSARLQQLLAVKRHERPAPGFSGAFLNEFHQRLQAQTSTRPSWWRQWLAGFSAQPVHTWRVAFAGGAAFVLTVSAVSSHWMFSAAGSVDGDARRAAADVTEPLLTAASLPASESMPTRAVASVLPPPAEPSSAGSVVIVPAAAHADNDEAGAPRYVLDRITAAPASYEVASIHF